MRQPATGRSTTRRTLRAIGLGMVLVVVAIVEVLIARSAPVAAISFEATAALDPGAITGPHAITDADGVLPGGVTVFDDRYPGVTRLDPALRAALRRATTDAARDRIEIDVNSGWRSRSYQDQLLREAVAAYGSSAEAARWVATADTSPHVAGAAVDIGPDDATAWLSARGAHYGLCQIYRNEPWHFELRPAAVNGGCPRPYADPTQDPRMRR